MILYTNKKVSQYLSRELFPMSSEKISFESRLRGSNLNIVIISDPQIARFDFVQLGVKILHQESKSVNLIAF